MINLMYVGQVFNEDLNKKRMSDCIFAHRDKIVFHTTLIVDAVSGFNSNNNLPCLAIESGKNQSHYMY